MKADDEASGSPQMSRPSRRRSGRAERGRGGQDRQPVRHPPADRRRVPALRADPGRARHLRIHAVKTKAAGINIDLWTGLGMLIFGGLMIFWALARPVAPEPPEGRGKGSGLDPAGRPQRERRLLTC